MSHTDIGISNRSRSVFDAILEWENKLREQSEAVDGFLQYTHALEGMLQDPASRQYTELFSRRLWHWLDLARVFLDGPDAPRVFLSYIHTLIRWLVIRLSGKKVPKLPPQRLFSSKELDFDRVGSLGYESRRQFAITVLGKKRFDEIIARFRNARSLVSPTPPEIDAIKQVFLIELRDSMTAAILGSEFTHLVLKSLSHDDLPRRSREMNADLGQACQTDGVDTQLTAEAPYTMTILICFLDSDVSVSRAGRALWSIGTALECIDGVTAVIESWGDGSRWARFKVFIRNIWSRDEVREVLEKGRQAAVSQYLDRPTEEVRKMAAEREKLEEEKKAIEQKRCAEPSEEEQRRLIELQIREKELGVEAKQLDNALKKVEVLQKASDLVRDGIVTADKVRIDVDALCVFLFDGKKVITNPIPIEDASSRPPSQK